MRYTSTFKCYPGLSSGQLLLGFLIVRYLLISTTHRIIFMFDLRSVWYWRFLIWFESLQWTTSTHMYNYKWKLIKVTIEKPNILNIFCGMSHHTRCLHDIRMYDAQFTMRLYTLSFKVCFPIGKYQNHKHESSKW